MSGAQQALLAGDVNARGFTAGGNLVSDLTFQGCTKIERFKRMGEVVTTIAAVLSAKRTHGGCGVTGRVKGYMMGGDNSVNNSVSTIEALTFSSEGVATIGATLDAVKGCNHVSGVNSYTKGYMMGGATNNGTNSSAIEDLNFSTEASAAIGATLSDIIRFGTGVSSTANGYLMGGQNATVLMTSIDKLAFSGETRSTLSATIDAPARQAGMGVNSDLKGYMMGGNNAGPPSNKIDDLTFSGETSVQIAATLDAGRQSAGRSSFFDRGYLAGGYDGTNFRAEIENLVFADESNAAISAVLSEAVTDQSSVYSGGML